MVRKLRKAWQLAPRRACSQDAIETQAIITACETLIASVLKPRALPATRRVDCNYLIDIRGDWRAGRYRFLSRYRSGMAHNEGYEFDSPFARIDHMGPHCFDIHWMRHTGAWWPICTGKTLTEALHVIETEDVFRFF